MVVKGPEQRPASGYVGSRGLLNHGFTIPDNPFRLYIYIYIPHLPSKWVKSWCIYYLHGIAWEWRYDNVKQIAKGTSLTDLFSWWVASEGPGL